MSHRNGNGRVPLIGQTKEMHLQLVHHDTPNAFPVSQLVPEGDGKMKLMLFGGLNKLEWMAGQVAIGCGLDIGATEIVDRS